MLHIHAEKLFDLADAVNPITIHFNTINISLNLLIIELICFKKITDRFLYFYIRNGMQILAHSLFSVFNPSAHRQTILPSLQVIRLKFFSAFSAN